MRAAAIDIGTNSTRLLVAELDRPDGEAPEAAHRVADHVHHPDDLVFLPLVEGDTQPAGLPA